MRPLLKKRRDCEQEYYKAKEQIKHNEYCRKLINHWKARVLENDIPEGYEFFVNSIFEKIMSRVRWENKPVEYIGDRAKILINRIRVCPQPHLAIKSLSVRLESGESIYSAVDYDYSQTRDFIDSTCGICQVGVFPFAKLLCELKKHKFKEN